MPANKRKALHERIGLWGWLRSRLRRRLFAFLEKLAATDEAKAIHTAMLENVFARRPLCPRLGLDPSDSPYPDLGQAPAAEPAGPPPIIISARFRTGSTLLWNVFRHLPNCTAYYEPFNERRWFDPAVRGGQTDPTHREIEEYWREYDGLSVLGDYYDERWIDHDLLMDASDSNPRMKRYVELLIERAPGRAVLQFNRIDFRLPWLRYTFPRAKIVHLYRHPRDQWCSSLVNVAACPRECTVQEFGAYDHYYLRNWARDLRYHFPFLDESAVAHPYRLFYLIWKLSYVFGRTYADHSLAYEHLTSDPAAALQDLFAAVDVANPPVEQLHRLIEKSGRSRWRDYADEAWFQGHEAACEQVIADFFRAAPEAAGGCQPALTLAEREL